MPVTPAVYGLPGFRDAQTATPRLILRQGRYDYLAGGKIIDGSASRDPGNTGNIDRLQAGMLMGMITATTYGGVAGLYAPALIGVLQSAYTSGGTTLTVTAAQALELDRQLGQSGTSEMVCIGPPSSAGTVAVTNVTHSAINTSTGAITVSSLGVNKIAGSFLAINDGRYLPRTILVEDFPVAVTDGDGNSIDVPFPKFPVGGVIISDNVLPAWPSDTSLQAWILTQLNSTYPGNFVFDHAYQV